MLHFLTIPSFFTLLAPRFKKPQFNYGSVGMVFKGDGKVFTPAGKDFTPAGASFNNAGIVFRAAGKVFTPAGTSFNNAGIVFRAAGLVFNITGSVFNGRGFSASLKTERRQVNTNAAPLNMFAVSAANSYASVKTNF